ncbi:MAG: formylglycine-generating enzyme family protein [Bacteroidota bacterium]
MIIRGFLGLFLLTICLGCSDAQRPDEPEGMRCIPSGSFLMGAKDAQGYPDEYPQHEVEVPAFFLDATEVTNAEFAAFVAATGYVTLAERDIVWEELQPQLPPGTPRWADSLLAAGSLVFRSTDQPVPLHDPSQWWEWTVGANWQHPEGPDSDLEGRTDHPVVHIAWEDAAAYAQRAGKRLPTEAEWEWAAMGGTDNAVYPWGNTPAQEATAQANFWQGLFPVVNDLRDGHYATAPVGSYPANGYGLYDMAGNVWEWCQDKYDARTYQELQRQGKTVNPQGSAVYFDPSDPQSPKHLMRGGSFLCNDDYCSGYRTSRRMSSSRDSGFNHTGFRCAKNAE